VACLDGLAVVPVFVPDAAEGMGASIRTGVAALPDGCGAVMILPADLPELLASDLRVMLDAWQDRPDAILRAVDQDGKHGHPVIFPADLFPALRGCKGDAGARDVLRAHQGRIVTLPLPGRHATTDLDTPEDWAAWRARQ
jgi:molybdenum cofactor cytidylyltransferase